MRTAVAAAVACALLTGLSVAADVQASIKREVSIPAGGLGPALRALSDERKIHFVFVAGDVHNLRTPGASGSLTIDEALHQLLNGTGLTYRYIDDQTVSILPLMAPSVPASSGATSATPFTTFEEQGAAKPAAEDRRSSFWSRFRLARLDQGTQPPGSSRDNAEPNQLALEEIIVTAQKREEKLQDVPISISVLSGQDLDKSTVDGATEALRRVPGVGINESYQGGGTQVAVRGVTAGGALFNGSSPVSYYLDSVPFGMVRNAIGPDINAYDLERIEVLRGPQGTLYGASAQNGVVRVLTKDASLNEFAFKARTSASSTEGGGENYRGDLAINVPIVTGKLAARAVLGYQDLSGWIDRPNKSDANDAEIRNMRLKVNGQPTEQLSISASVWLSRSDYGGPAIADDEGFRAATLGEPIVTDFDVYGLQLGYDLPRASIASVTSYLNYSNDSFLDIGNLVPDLYDQTNLTSHVFSQEVTLNSDDEGPWRWSLGGIYRDAEDLQYQVSRFNGQLLDPDNDQTYMSKSFAVFGELTRKFLDGRLELTGGLRYFEDDVTSRDHFRLVEDDSTFDALSPRVVITWHAHDDLTTYASYAEGFRSGFPQSGRLLAAAPQFPSLDADTLHNYEVGAKGSLWNGIVSFDTALYYIDWQDVQQSLTVPVSDTNFVTALVNAGSASGVGFDFGVTTRPAEGLELGVNFSWNDLEMDTEVISGGVLLFDKGDRLNVSPEYTVGASADYDFPLGANGFKGLFSASANYTSEMDTRTIAVGQNIAFGDAMLIARASFAIAAPDHWTATLFIDNLNNEQGSAVRFPIFHDFLPWDTRVRPRTIGAQLEYRF